MISHREYNKSEVPNHAGVARQTVGNYIDLLLDIEIASSKRCRKRANRSLK